MTGPAIAGYRFGRRIDGRDRAIAEREVRVEAVMRPRPALDKPDPMKPSLRPDSPPAVVKSSSPSGDTPPAG